MCYVDDGCDVWNLTHRKARKRHRCDECGGAIPVAVLYAQINTLFEGRWDILRVHAECMQLWNDVHRVLCGGEGLILIGGLHEELRQYEGDGRAKRFLKRFNTILDKYRGAS